MAEIKKPKVGERYRITRDRGIIPAGEIVTIVGLEDNGYWANIRGRTIGGWEGTTMTCIARGIPDDMILVGEP